jgi:hypothetical protein
MTGLPEFNYPLFNAVAKRLRELGHEVLNPAENSTPPCGTWAGYMRMALVQLVQCECIVLLPGWAESRGALLERSIAQALGIDIAHFSDSQMRAMVPLLTALDAPGHTRCAVDWSAA